MTESNDFLKSRGPWRDLIVYQKAECLYDVTYYFAHTYMERGDRTVDQMVQAARSGKQNIVEGSVAAATSSETEIKLFNVARASLQELICDYEDYLRVKGLEQWPVDSPKCIQARKACKAHSDSAFYREAIAKRSDCAIANIAITLIHQIDNMLGKLIHKAKERFLEKGGAREEMTRERLKARKAGFPTKE